MSDRPILFAVTHTGPGGVRELWCDIAEGLRARGHTIGLVGLYPLGSEAAEAGREGWRLIVPQRPRGPLAAARLLWRLVRFLRATRPAAIVTAQPALNALVPLAAWLAGGGIRVVITHHSPTHTHNPLLDRLGGWTGLLPGVAAVVSVSDAVAHTLDAKPAAYRARRQTIHNALPERIEQDLDALKAARDAAGHVRGRRVVALGRLHPQKNHPLLIAALAQVPGATLEIVGEGADRAQLEAQIAAAGLAGRVHLRGYCPRAQALKIAAEADVFAQVSLYEGHSLALIEAARLGLPLIVSDIPEQVEAVTAADGTLCAAVVPLGDAGHLAGVLMDILDDSQIYARWAALSARLGQESSNAVMIDRYERLLAPDTATTPAGNG